MPLRTTLLPAILLASVLSPVAASAAIYTYDLNGSLASSSGGPSLVANGGSLGSTGYSFGPNQGLSFGPAGGQPITSYALSVDFFFTDAPTSRGNGYRKIVDFSGLASDAGLYTHNGAVSLFPNREAGSIGFNSASAIDLSRSSAGLVSVSLNGTQLFTYDDSVSNSFVLTNANQLRFFEDDASTSFGEAGTGFVDSISVTTNGSVSPVPLPASAPMFGAAVLGLAGAGYLARRRTSTTTA